MIHPSRGVVLAFYRGSGLVSGLIRWRTWGRWSHVGIVLPTQGEMTQIIDSTIGHGVTLRNLPPADAYLWIPAAPRDDVVRVAESLRGSKYDYSGLLAFLLRSSRFDRPDKLVCSEFVIRVFELIGYPLLRIESGRASPDHVWMTPLGEVIG